MFMASTELSSALFEKAHLMKIAFAAVPLLLFAAASGSIAHAQTTPAVPADATPAKELPKPSKKALKSLIELSNAVKAKDAAAIAAALPQAKANATNPGDIYLIGMLMMNFALAAKDNAALGTAVDQIVQSNYLSTKEAAELYRDLGGTYSAAKQYDLATGAYDRAVALDPTNSALLVSLAESRFAANNIPAGVDALRKAIAATAAVGGKAPEPYYRRAVGMAFIAKLPTTSDLARDWVSTYPNPDSWHNALAIYQNMNKPDLPIAIELYRLMGATNALEVADYAVYSSLAFENGNYVEAQAVIDAGVAAGKIQRTSAGVKPVVAALAAKPKTTAADLAEAARSVKDAAGKFRVAERYLGMGDYAKAVALYREADGKPGVDQNLLKLHLGIALARSGDKTGAQEALAAVQGPLQPMAAYWQIYVKQLA